MAEIREAVIVGAARTPIGKRNGSLKDTHPVDLLAAVLKEVVERAGVDPGQIEDNITRVPMGSSMMGQVPFSNAEMARYEGKLVPQGISADLIATKWNITREDSDDFAFRSHTRAAAATKAGYFKREILPLKVTGPDGAQMLLDVDEGIRMEPDREKMGALQPAFQAPHF